MYPQIYCILRIHISVNGKLGIHDISIYGKALGIKADIFSAILFNSHILKCLVVHV